MTKEMYSKLSAPFQKSRKRTKLFITAEHILTGLVYLSYPSLLLYLSILRDFRVWRCLLVPAFTFVAVSVFRRLLNTPRPYEQLKFKPLLPKEKKGESFPSRHVFSVFMIAMAYYYICIPMGIYLTVIGVLLAIMRVVGGVHYPKDVLCGAAIGIGLGAIGFFAL